MSRLKAMPTWAKGAVGVLIAVLAFTLGGCTSASPTAQEKENSSLQSGYEALVNQQPGKDMSYSPTRDTINFWVDTWNKPNKLSYVYMQNADGKMTGYYVFKGLPVSYCAALKPTVKEDSNEHGRLLIPQPSVDGVYYSGGQCNTFFGKDATSGSYIEYTAGLGINVLLYDQPLPRQDVQPLGPSTIEAASKLPQPK